MSSIKQIQVAEIALTTGGTVSLDSGDITAAPFYVAESAYMYRVTGTQTLASNFSITNTGTLTKNIRIIILWEANAAVSAGKDVIIFGKTVPQSLLNGAGGNKVFRAECIYSGSKFSVNISMDAGSTGYIGEDAIENSAVTTVKMALLSVTTAILNDLSVVTGKIADLAVTTAKIADANITTAKMALLSVTTAIINDLAVTTGKIDNKAVTAAKIADGTITATQIADGAVTPTKISANANKYTRDIPISFETSAEVGVVNFIMCEDCTVDMVSGTVMSPFADDDGTVIFKNNAGTVMTGSQIDFGTGLVLGNQVTNTVTGNNSFTAGQKITLELSKTTTTSGKAIISLCITKV